MHKTYSVKTYLIACLLFTVCAASGQAGERLMAYSNPSHAAEIDDTARYYHDKYYPQLKLVREDEMRSGGELAVFVGSLDVSPFARELIWQCGI